jgi:hypothetical protein
VWRLPLPQRSFGNTRGAVRLVRLEVLSLFRPPGRSVLRWGAQPCRSHQRGAWASAGPPDGGRFLAGSRFPLTLLPKMIPPPHNSQLAFPHILPQIPRGNCLTFYLPSFYSLFLLSPQRSAHWRNFLQRARQTTLLNNHTIKLDKNR